LTGRFRWRWSTAARWWDDGWYRRRRRRDYGGAVRFHRLGFLFIVRIASPEIVRCSSRITGVPVTSPLSILFSVVVVVVEVFRMGVPSSSFCVGVEVGSVRF
jgi:hypothetical protein